jgi:Saxitoxin biosynthesis operon protein SxtJ
MLIQEFKSIDSSSKEIWKFSYIVGIVLLIIGIVLFIKHNPIGLYLGTAAVILILLGYFLPKVLLPLHKIWMGLAVILGFLSTHLILSLLYFLVVTPIGLTAKLFGQDFLKIKKISSESYWIPKPLSENEKDRYTKQF